jgi:hypothetical protein
MYLLVERSVGPGKRVLRVVCLALLVLLPSTFQANVSYRTHAIGLGLGVISALIYFQRNRESIRSAEVVELEEPFDDPEEILRSVKRGVYAKRFSGGQVNISNGDFVFSLTESYLIEDGKLTAPLKGVNLIGNGPDVLRRVDMLGADFELSDGIWTCGKDGQSLPVNVGTPTVRISSITVGGTQA